MAAPLLVHLVFHPRSKNARLLADVLDHALNDDGAIPGLRIPTFILPENADRLPPGGDLKEMLDQAERSVAVVLADDVLANDADDRNGARGWGRFVADLRDACGTQHRFAPVELEPAVWPLDVRLQGTNFYRGYAIPPAALTPAEQQARVVRQVVVATCRFLADQELGTRAPVAVFISHAKQDIRLAPRVFDAIKDHLESTQPVRAWVDSGQIEGGDVFGEEIEKGVKDSAVLVLATKSYSSREWCRKEVLFAKKHQRPVLVVNALQETDARWFPYLGNAPLVSWTEGSAERVVTLLLKEALRRIHTKLLLEQKREENDVLLTAPPELATVVPIEKGRGILYPDPPLGDEETALFTPLGHRVETPLQRVAKRHLLATKVVALSLSEVESPERYGVTARMLDAMMTEITRYLLVSGAALAYGGHLGSGGYTLKLFDFVRAYRDSATAPPIESIRHYYGWPLPLGPEESRQYRRQARLTLVPRPDGVDDLEPALFVERPDRYFAPDTPARRFAWARGMTAMRELQTKEVAARIVLGGKSGGASSYSGRIPGVLEEAFLSVEAKKPVYIVGGFGGIGAIVADALEGKPREELTWEFQKGAPHSEGMRKLYDERGVPFVDYDAIVKLFADTGVKGVSALNGLDEAQNRELFRTRDQTRVVELIVSGLARLTP